MAWPASACAAVLRDYFRAKDSNRPHLLEFVFTENATLEIRNRSTAITFPATSQGRAAIADVLVRRFNQTYENIYSFYLQRPEAETDRFECAWLAGMSDKESGAVRVGCGRYAWQFTEVSPCRATHLTIAIESMEILPASTLGPVLDWLTRLAYPWCPPAAVRAHSPPLVELAPVLFCLDAIAQ
jgi:hypothetical protein